MTTSGARNKCIGVGALVATGLFLSAFSGEAPLARAPVRHSFPGHKAPLPYLPNMTQGPTAVQLLLISS